MSGVVVDVPMLLLLPWCRITKPYRVAEIELLPFPALDASPSRDKPFDEDTNRTIKRLLSAYRDLNGKPVERAAVVRYNGRDVTEELSEEEIANARELIELVCFSALARRNLFSNEGPYCNRDVFSLYVQWFTKPPDAIAIETVRARGAGHNRSLWRLDDLHLGVPPHVGVVDEVAVDEALLAALMSLRADTSDKTWQRWFDAIASYNLANTDGDNFPLAAEWTLMCGAFQLLLDAKSTAENVARKLVSTLSPPTQIRISQSARNTPRYQSGPDLPLLEAWMREFYSIRGNLAHGWLEPKQPSSWSTAEHLTLVRLIFPLLVKTLLSKQDRYELTEEDKIWICSLDKIANTSFLTQTSFLARAPGRIKSQRAWRRAEEGLRAALGGTLAPSSDTDPGNPA